MFDDDVAIIFIVINIDAAATGSTASSTYKL